MPDINEYSTQEEWMKVCVPKMMDEGKSNDQAVGACMGMWAQKQDAAKYHLLMASVKAVGDWELEVRVLPFTKDSDGQWFDANTDIMQSAFSTPLVIYQHGVKQGAKGFDGKPVIVGDSIPGSLEKRSDGWYIKVVLNKALKQAKDIMDAAWKGLVAVSSDSIAHLARLDIGGKLIPYEKNKPGRIAVWPLAGFSLWEKGNGNFAPTNHSAIALPAMKAIYKEAGLNFPEIQSDGVLPEAEQAAKRTRIDQIKSKSKLILKRGTK